jgi:hypothetical protein
MIVSAAAAAATQPEDGWPAMLAVALFGLIFVAFLLDRLGLWMEKRGWICWRRTKRDARSGSGLTGGFLTEMQKLVEPRIEHRQQIMEERNESIGQCLGRGDDIDDPNDGNENGAKKEVP